MLCNGAETDRIHGVLTQPCCFVSVSKTHKMIVFFFAMMGFRVSGHQRMPMLAKRAASHVFMSIMSPPTNANNVHHPITWYQLMFVCLCFREDRLGLKQAYRDGSEKNRPSHPRMNYVGVPASFVGTLFSCSPKSRGGGLLINHHTRVVIRRVLSLAFLGIRGSKSPDRTSLHYC